MGGFTLGDPSAFNHANMQIKEGVLLSSIPSVPALDALVAYLITLT